MKKCLFLRKSNFPTPFAFSHVKKEKISFPPQLPKFSTKYQNFLRKSYLDFRFCLSRSFLNILIIWFFSHVHFRYRVVDSYPAHSDVELHLLPGDIIFVHKKREDGWFKGTSQRNGKTGLFPGTFVEKLWHKMKVIVYHFLRIYAMEDIYFISKRVNICFLWKHKLYFP